MPTPHKTEFQFLALALVQHYIGVWNQLNSGFAIALAPYLQNIDFGMEWNGILLDTKTRGIN